MLDCVVVLCCGAVFFFFFKQKTAYEMRISDWSSDVCSSDLIGLRQMRSGLGFVSFELTETSRGGFAFHGGASAFGDRFPGVGLIVHFRGAGTGGASAEIGRASCRERVCQYV